MTGNAPVKPLATGFDWIVGPVGFGDAACLLFSDLPNSRIRCWSEERGVTAFRAPSHSANGHTRDRQLRLISSEHGTCTEWDGTVTVIADGCRGKRLNSPNDVVVSRDGAIWFTDPHHGIMTDYDGLRAEQELPCQVCRADPDGTIEAVITDMQCPNGPAFSPGCADGVHCLAPDGRLPGRIVVPDLVPTLGA